MLCYKLEFRFGQSVLLDHTFICLWFVFFYHVTLVKRNISFFTLSGAKVNMMAYDSLMS